MPESSPEEQFEEVKPLCEMLFDLSAMFIAKQGNFLPHGAVLDMYGKTAMTAAAPENDMTDATEVLPLLHDGLRAETGKAATQAVAVSENVYIGPDQSPAIKVLVEHRDGLTLAMYQTFKKRLLRAPALGDVQVIEADPEVGGWSKALPFS